MQGRPVPRAQAVFSHNMRFWETKRRLTAQCRHINRSLFDLASCIHALCDGNRDHVPFRQGDSRHMIPHFVCHRFGTTTCPWKADLV